jgi:hypothetical protein
VSLIYIWAVPSFLAVRFASFLVKLWLFKTQGYDISQWSIIAQIKIATILLMKFLWFFHHQLKCFTEIIVSTIQLVFSSMTLRITMFNSDYEHQNHTIPICWFEVLMRHFSLDAFVKLIFTFDWAFFYLHVDGFYHLYNYILNFQWEILVTVWNTELDFTFKFAVSLGYTIILHSFHLWYCLWEF